MMLSPEEYFAYHLQGKTARQIRTRIASLKAQIRQLEKQVANPQEYLEAWMICPDPQTQLEMTRLYLQTATSALLQTEKRQSKP